MTGLRMLCAGEVAADMTWILVMMCSGMSLLLVLLPLILLLLLLLLQTVVPFPSSFCWNMTYRMDPTVAIIVNARPTTAIQPQHGVTGCHPTIHKLATSGTRSMGILFVILVMTVLSMTKTSPSTIPPSPTCVWSVRAIIDTFLFLRPNASPL
jgi:hypothetical protein